MLGSPTDVGSANADGIADTLPRSDHVHRGVHSIREIGEALLYGDVTLSEGASISLTQVANNIAIAFTGVAIPASLIPSIDDSFDIGENTTPLEWKDLYIDGVAYIDTLSLDTTDGLGVATTMKPTVDDSFDLGEGGGTPREWKDVYIDGVAYIDTLRADVAITFETDNTTDIGTSIIEAKDVYVDGYVYADNVRVDAIDGVALQLGTATVEGGDFYIYLNATGDTALIVDADAMDTANAIIMTIGDVTDDDLSTNTNIALQIYGHDGTALRLGDATTEGGNIIVYANAAGDTALIVDADAMLTASAKIVAIGDATIGNLLTNSDISLLIYGWDGTALQLGDATTEGGDIVVYEDAGGNIGFQLDADVATLTLGNTTTKLGTLIIDNYNAAGAIPFTVFADDGATAQYSFYIKTPDAASLQYMFSMRINDVPYGGVSDYEAGLYIGAGGTLSVFSGPTGAPVSYLSFLNGLMNYTGSDIYMLDTGALQGYITINSTLGAFGINYIPFTDGTGRVFIGSGGADITVATFSEVYFNPQLGGSPQFAQPMTSYSWLTASGIIKLNGKACTTAAGLIFNPLFAGTTVASTITNVRGISIGGGATGATKTVNVTNWSSIYASMANCSATVNITTLKGLEISNNPTDVTITTNIGVDIAAFTVGTTKIGIKVGGADYNALQMGTSTTEGGNIVVYQGTANRTSFNLDADTSLTIGNATDAFTTTLYGKTVFAEASLLTVSGGIITVVASNNVVAPEAGVSDNLATINGGVDGMIIIIRGSGISGAVVLTVQDGVGNINCNNDFAMDSIYDTMTLMYDDTNSVWVELARSSNA